MSVQLRRLREKEISLEEYLDYQVEEALRPLRGLISSEQLEIVRETVRDELADNPVLIEMVRRVTGMVPALPSDS